MNANAQVVTTLHSFKSEGFSPVGSLVQDTDGTLYGATQRGGIIGGGTIFKVDSSGALQTVYYFRASGDGQIPKAGLLAGFDGNFYGTTSSGGSYGFGTIFKLTHLGAETVLYSFGRDFTGISPTSSLIEGGDGGIFGTAPDARHEGPGALFKIDLNGNFTALHRFPGDYQPANQDLAVQRGRDANFYGATFHDGSKHHGTAFKMTPAGKVTTLHTFDINELDPVGPPVQGLDGNLYGVTSGGSFYRLAPSGVETIIGDFFNFPLASLNLIKPQCPLICGSDGDLYGVTAFGGANGFGSIYRIKSDGTGAVLYDFKSPSIDGDNCSGALLEGLDGNFYGAMSSGGLAQDAGTLFRLRPDGSETTFARFGGSNEGANPTAGLVEGADGNLYGTTESTVFKVTPSGALSIFYDFGMPDSRTYDPNGPLVLGSDGNFYGTAAEGGSLVGGGTVFKITPSGDESILHAFGDQVGDGRYPRSGLIQASDGNFYGTTTSDGDHGKGTIFRITPAGDETTLYDFEAPYSGTTTLTLGPGGNLYGTIEGSSGGLGAVFKITTAGMFTILHSFVDYPQDGNAPLGSLILASDGNLYGTTSKGGVHYQGTVFKITPAGELTTLYHFGAHPGDGSHPNSALVQIDENTFCGTTDQGGDHGAGTVYKITTSGEETVLYHFGGAIIDATNSVGVGALAMTKEGAVYGTTSVGGEFANGSVFRLFPNASRALAAQPDAAVMTSGGGDIDVLANDVNPTNGALTITIASPPSLGRAGVHNFVDGSSKVSYHSSSNYARFDGIDSFQYTISNAEGDTSTAEVFIGNPFSLKKGTYSGSLANPNDGSLTLTLSGTGTFSGKLHAGGKTIPFTGQLSLSGSFTAFIHGSVLTLHFDAANLGGDIHGNYGITGTYGDAAFELHHAISAYYSRANPAPEAGYYTVLLRAANPADESALSGTGFATMTVSEAGRVRVNGKLADGASFAIGASLNAGDDIRNSFVVDAKIHSRGATLRGEMTFEDMPGVSDCDGPLTWTKPSSAFGDPAIHTTMNVIASRYAPATRTTLDSFALDVPLDEHLYFALDGSTGNSLSEVRGNTLTFGFIGEEVVTINPKLGTFRGKWVGFLDPLTFRGVLFHKQSKGGGFYVSPLFFNGSVSIYRMP